MSVPDSSLKFASNVLVSLSYAFLSYLLGRMFRFHRLTIGCLSWTAAYGVRLEITLYNNTYKITFTSPSITWSFHRPRSTDPRWCTVILNDVYFVSTTGIVSLERFEVVLWFFPVFFRQTAGPWANVTAEELRIQIFKSTETPYWIKRLRENLVSTLLTGETIRADLFRTTARMSGFADWPEEQAGGHTMSKSNGGRSASEEQPNQDPEGQGGNRDGPPDWDVREKVRESVGKSVAGSEKADVVPSSQGRDKYATAPMRTFDRDELNFNMTAQQLHINDNNGRIYAFGCFDSQMRRNWTQNRGSLVVIAEECRWVRVQFPFERVAPRHWCTQLISSVFHFPIDLVRTFNYPISSINLYITRLDVKFDSFRLRDAELFKQGVVAIHQAVRNSGVDWNDVLLDAIARVLAPR